MAYTPIEQKLANLADDYQRQADAIRSTLAVLQQTMHTKAQAAIGDKLKQATRIINNGRPGKTPYTNGTSKIEQAYAYLLAHGPSSAQDIQRAVGIKNFAASHVSQKARFRRVAVGIYEAVTGGKTGKPYTPPVSKIEQAYQFLLANGPSSVKDITAASGMRGVSSSLSKNGKYRALIRRVREGVYEAVPRNGAANGTGRKKKKA